MFQKTVKRIKRRIIRIKERKINPIIIGSKTKIFCIGNNKTGTTSFEQAFIDLGYIVGNTREAAILLPHYIKGDFKPIIDYCKTAQVFQDFPFSFPNTYKYIDQAFPGSKFVLTVRDTPEQWYNSITKFHSKVFGKGNLPTKNDLQNATFIWKGYMWDLFSSKFNTPEDDIYNKDILLNYYNAYNNEVTEYFSSRPNDLIVINLNEEGSYKKLMVFLEIDSPYNDFPWKNKTNTIKVKL